MADPEEQPTAQGSPGSAKRFGYSLQGSFCVDLLIQHSAFGLVADDPQQVALEVWHSAVRLREPHKEGPFALRKVDIEAKPWRRREATQAPRSVRASSLLSRTAAEHRVLTEQRRSEEHCCYRVTVHTVAVESKTLFQGVSTLPVAVNVGGATYDSLHGSEATPTRSICGHSPNLFGTSAGTLEVRADHRTAWRRGRKASGFQVLGLARFIE